MKTHLTEDDLVHHYNGEMLPVEEAHASEHLNACTECHSSFRRLQRVLAVIDETGVGGPVLPDGF